MGMVIGSLVFWKVGRGRRPDAKRLDEALQAGNEPAALEPLPVPAMLSALKDQYPTMEWSDGFAEVDLDDVQAGIEVSWKPRHFRFDFYGDGFAQMDVVAALMARFGCACYFVGEADAYPPDRVPKFHDPQHDAEFDAKLEAMRAHAMAAGADPQARLKAALAFMKLTDPANQEPKPNTKATPGRRTPAEKSAAHRPTSARKKKRRT